MAARMGNWWMGIGLLVAGLAILQALLIGLQTWEHRRFARSRLRCGKSPRPTTGRAVLFVPCRGLDEGLKRICAAVRPRLRQLRPIHPRRSLRSGLPGDPAAARGLSPNPLTDHLCRAGRTQRSEVHNLRRATEHLPDDVEYLAFVDADARPAPHWLTALLACLEQPGSAPPGIGGSSPSGHLANHLLYSLNCNIAMLFSLRGRTWSGAGPGPFAATCSNGWSCAKPGRARSATTSSPLACSTRPGCTSPSSRPARSPRRWTSTCPRC